MVIMSENILLSCMDIELCEILRSKKLVFSALEYFHDEVRKTTKT
jgi:hypothetical protein